MPGRVPAGGPGGAVGAGSVTRMSVTDSTELSPRMRLILESATRVVAAGGMRGLTHRAVDAEAGLPQGSTSGSVSYTHLTLQTNREV